MQKSKASRTIFICCEVIFDLDQLQKELDQIEKTMAQADFWQKSQDEITRLSQQRVFLRGKIDRWNQYSREAEDAKLLAEMAFEEGDQPTLKEVEQDVSRIEARVKDLELQLLLSEPDDKRNAIVAINSGRICADEKVPALCAATGGVGRGFSAGRERSAPELSQGACGRPDLF